MNERIDYFYYSNNKSDFYQNSKTIVKEEYYLKYLDYFNKTGISTDYINPWRYVRFEKNENYNKTGLWKIHISSNKDNYNDILDILLPFLINKEINFKFISSKSRYLYINSKNISSVISGKDITIYPKDSDFLSIIESIYNLLKKYKFKGSYILTDLKYKDSNIIFYRYGGYKPICKINKYGVKKYYLLNNKYELVEDVRLPYYIEYDWKEKYNFEYEDTQESILLKKYKVDMIISSGGATTSYLGYDNSSKVKVFIKEAREFTGLDSSGKYSTDRIKKEFKILSTLKKDYLVKPKEMIEEGGNVYLIEEYIDGISLLSWINLNNFLYKPYKNISYIKRYFRFLENVLFNILKAFEDLDKEGILINDISLNNIIVKSNNEIKLIDFEYVFYKNDNDYIDIFTPAFIGNSSDKFISENNKIKKLILFMFLPFTKLIDFDKFKIYEILNWYISSFYEYIPVGLMNILYKIQNSEVISYSDYLLLLNSKECYNERLEKKYIKKIFNKNNYLIFLKKSIETIINTFSINNLSKYGYIFPGDPEIFITNPLNISSGAFGILYAMDYLSRSNNIKLPHKFLNAFDYCINLLLKSNNLPKGFANGYAGISWVLVEMGYVDLAEKILLMGSEVDTNLENDLYYGKSGLIFSKIKLYLVTNNIKYLNDALKIAEDILINNKNQHYSLYEGDSGICLCFSYLYLINKDDKFLDFITNHIEKEMQIYDFNHYLKNNFEFKTKDISENEKVFYPYISNGISGVGMTLIRLYKITNDYKYYNKILEYIRFLDNEITSFPSYRNGLIGIMDFLMDCMFVINDKEILKKIMKKLNKMFEFLSIFYFKDKSMFIGKQSFKISLDLLTGTSGILMVLDRYNKLKNQNLLLPNKMFYLDKELELFCPKKLEIEINLTEE